ncbi:BQ2448_4363 [Microbotryum intermedium]|uniref:BQ2448_4363 protein n=1 Tax=Microbotryum intermedium TaxID=269621 RepID=A0A238FP06_9BASI|nr:BQ2448_4363 [Microbotryum intermedium]
MLFKNIAIAFGLLLSSPTSTLGASTADSTASELLGHLLSQPCTNFCAVKRNTSESCDVFKVDDIKSCSCAGGDHVMEGTKLLKEMDECIFKCALYAAQLGAIQTPKIRANAYPNWKAYKCKTCQAYGKENVEGGVGLAADGAWCQGGIID